MPLHLKILRENFFPYFKLVKSYDNYQSHFLVVKKGYIRNGR